MDATTTQTAARQEWQGLLATAGPGRLAALCGPLEPAGTQWLRPAEIGTVMVRGRVGGTGAPFNLGEVTVTRASVRLACGMVGHGHVQGRDLQAARLAALCDALLQTAAAEGIRQRVLGPLAAEAAGRAQARATRAAATRVEFFTLARGEDP
jgi:alpha-D-ribose 1-methylphosphonate 5-triphosphate synthase subunit PhnG